MRRSDSLRALIELDACGFITHTQEVAERVYLAGAPLGWRSAAREAAALLTGRVMPLPGGGMAWYSGAGQAKCTVVDPRNYTKILRSRETIAPLIDVKARVYWSLGSMARALLAYVGDPMPDEASNERFLTTHPYGYHTCTPGVYKSTGSRWTRARAQRDLFDEPVDTLNPNHKPGVRLYDCNGYYYQLFRRLETLRVSVSREGEITKFRMYPDDTARWKEVLAIVEEDKPLRNTIAGASVGSRSSFLSYTSAKPTKPEQLAGWYDGAVREIWTPGKLGPFRGAGLLIVATGAELCYRESLHVSSVYSTIDSVATVEGVPSVWASYGLPVGVKAQGAGEICHIGSYRIGPRLTKCYGSGEREWIQTAPREVPDTFAKQWL